MLMNAKDVRANFGDVINRAAYSKERITVTKNGKPVAVIVSIEDLKVLEDLAFEAAMRQGNQRLGAVLAKLGE